MIKISAFAGLALGSLVNFSAVAADMPLKAPPAPIVESWTYVWYLEGRLGGPLPKDYDISIANLGNGTYRPSSGLHGAADIGVEVARHWRFEFEFTDTTARDGNVNLGGFNIPHRGSTNIFTYGVNGLYSFDLAPYFKPFIGGGVGLADYHINNLGAVGGNFVINDSKTTPVVAFHAGIDVPITRQFVLTGRYTLADTGSMTFNSVPAGNQTTRSSTVDNIFTGGIRFYFQ